MVIFQGIIASASRFSLTLKGNGLHLVEGVVRLLLEFQLTRGLDNDFIPVPSTEGKRDRASKRAPRVKEPATNSDKLRLIPGAYILREPTPAIIVPCTI